MNNTQNITHTHHKKPTRRCKGTTFSSKKNYGKYRKKLKTLHSNKTNIVTNLSSITLTNAQLSLLNKGLTFNISSHKLHPNTLHNEISRFERTLQLHYFFSDKNSNTQNRPAFTSNPDWWPPKLSPKITNFCQELKAIISTHKHTHKPNNNLTYKERRALKELKQNKEIVIKHADKSAGIVILNRTDYETKILDMLNDTNTYTRTDIDDTTDVKKQADEIFTTLFNHNYISKKQFKHLTEFTAQTPTFYGIPKIHKKQNPLRPIVSQTNAPTSQVSKYLDKLLETAEKQIPHLLQDTTALLQLTEKHKHITPHAILVTLDVVALYTNIPQEEGANYVTEFYTNTLEHWDTSSHQLKPIPPETLKTLILFVLQNTTFEFMQQHYTQNYGTTMGASFSVKFANIYMHMFLSKFLAANNTISKPPFLARLVDDIFFPWYHSETELYLLVDTLNNHHTTIKFEMNHSQNEVNFLDTTIYIDKHTQTLHTKLYTKPTHKNQYLHYNSEHPSHVKKAIPYSQALRLRRITDNDDILHTELNTLKEKFIQRGYPQTLVETEINKVHQIERQNTLRYKSQQEKLENFNKFTKGDAFLPLIVTYSSSYNKSPTLKQQLNKHWHAFLDNNEKIKDAFHNTNPQLIYKKGQTLKKQLVSTKHKPTPTTLSDADQLIVQILQELEQEAQPHVSKCKHPLCNCCKSIQENNTFTSTTTKQTYSVETSMNCNSSYIIYLITCTHCKLQYVGQTNRKLKDRLNDHKSNTRTNKQTTVGIHFRSSPHDITNLQIIPIEQIEHNNQHQILIREQFWINTLQTKYPKGLNNYPIDKTDTTH